MKEPVYICKVDGVLGPNAICAKVKVSSSSPAPCGSDEPCSHKQLKQRKTCAGCQHLVKNHNSSPNFLVFYCGNTEDQLIVPHSAEKKADGWECMFSRVPEFCGLDDSEVLKSAKPAPKRDWVTTQEPIQGI